MPGCSSRGNDVEGGDFAGGNGKDHSNPALDGAYADLRADRVRSGPFLTEYCGKMVDEHQEGGQYGGKPRPMRAKGVCAEDYNGELQE